ncbi:MAG TPA: sigma-70 family RNA polymerase sigma factor, partial [Bacteroidia bacterium]|nr:sigma-70 family RNA polymerase sigma factor [Bacteroidia bacterium]
KLTSSIATFLFSICRFQWMNELRKRKKDASTPLSIDITAEDEKLFSEAIEEESKFKKAESAFMQLGEKCRELLQLFYHRKLDLKSIAGKLGFSNEKIAKNQKYRCLEKAKEIYSKS